MTSRVTHANIFSSNRKQNLGTERNLKARLIPSEKCLSVSGCGHKRPHPGASHCLCETASAELLSQPEQLSCQQYIYTNQEKQHSSHSSARTPSPQGMLFLARDLPKERTSAEPLPLRSGESWDSWKLCGPFLDPSHGGWAEKQGGSKPGQRQRPWGCKISLFWVVEQPGEFCKAGDIVLFTWSFNLVIWTN